MEEISFKVESVSYHSERDYPYELVVSREDLIHPLALEELTEVLIKFAATERGFYDGWETEVQVKE